MNWRKPIILAGLYLTAICEKGIFQKVGVTGRETKYILTRHKPDISINKYDMSAVSNASSLSAVKLHLDALRDIAGFRIRDALYERVLQDEGEDS